MTDFTWPDAPVGLSYFEFDLNPRPDRRWARITQGAHIFNLVFMGNCFNCGRSTWFGADGMPYQNLGSFLYVPYRGDGDKDVPRCYSCYSSGRRPDAAQADSAVLRHIPTTHPAYTSQMPSFLPFADESRAPKENGRLRKISDGSVASFKQWVDGGMFETTDGTVCNPAEWEVMTALHPGLRYTRVCAMASPVTVHKVVGWSGRSPLFGNYNAGAANGNVALVPMLNPVAEKPEQTITRMEYERTVMEFGFRARMILEGVARDWCAEFDPILDSIGLDPRNPKRHVVVTWKARVEMPNTLHEGNAEERLKARWSDYIHTRNLQVDSVEVEAISATTVLS